MSPGVETLSLTQGDQQPGNTGQTAWRQTQVPILLPPSSREALGRFPDLSETLLLPHKTAGDVSVSGRAAMRNK